MRQPVTLIAGPTASGKSALAVALAERDGSIVVNADSMQVYRDLNVLTARPEADDLARAPHLLYGHVDAAAKYSVARWLDDIREVIEQARITGRPLVIVGGTGLYFRALFGGLSRVPPIPQEVRDRWRAFAETAKPGVLHAALAERDAEMAARLEKGDTQRLSRALEVIEATGRSLLHWQQQTGEALLSQDTRRVVLAPPRPWLHARIEDRFARMVETGACEEARALMSRGLDPALPAMKAIGLRELASVAEGKLSVADAVVAATAATRQYAKRQETFFRGQLANWPRLNPSAGSVDTALTQF
ncbi:tRNA (adenosine(37)-N6)-dimethylallyltransferase MiaA [Stappia sp. ICDLI1TA098]